LTAISRNKRAIDCLNFLRRSAIGASLALLGIAGRAEPGTPPLPVEVIHFWTSESEARALQVLAKALEQRHGRWLDSPIVGSDAATFVALNRINGGDPPAAMLWELGNRVSGLADADMLNDMDRLAAQGHWAVVLPPLVLQHAMVGGHFIAAPVEIHGENWLWYNLKVLADAHVQTPKHWSEFFAAGDKLKANGVVPLALGGQDWQEVMLFNSVLLDVGGAALYRDFYVRHDANAARGAAMQRALQAFARLRSYVDRGSPGRSWNQATEMVIDGRAAMQIMGDWAKREFTRASLTAGQDFGCALAPGSGNNYILAVDAFVFPKTADARKRAAQDLLAGTIMDPAVQIAFNQAKGSVPVRRDIALADLDACGQIGARAMADPASQLPNPALALDSYGEGAVGDVIARFWFTPTMSPSRAAALLADAISYQ
jgi:glucose/mannose transport system substrate-binding protein